MLKLQDRFPVEQRNFREIILCTGRSGDTAHEGGGATIKLYQQFLTPLSVACCGRPTMSSPLGYFSRLLQVVDN